MEYRDGEKFIDNRTGDIWTLHFSADGTPYVLSNLLGKGHWDDGRHLVKLANDSK